MKTILKILGLVIIAIVITVVSCKKEANSSVPLVSVDIYLNMSLPSYLPVSTPGGWVYITGGVRGILLYRKSPTEFMAYDRNCTYQSGQPCATVVVDATNILAVDTCCHSKFSIYDGSVTSPPANLPLKQYSTTYDAATYSLHIFN